MKILLALAVFLLVVSNTVMIFEDREKLDSALTYTRHGNTIKLNIPQGVYFVELKDTLFIVQPDGFGLKRFKNE